MFIKKYNNKLSNNMNILKIYHSNVDDKLPTLLEYKDNRWLISNFSYKNIFFIIKKEQNSTKIVNIAYCLKYGYNISFNK